MLLKELKAALSLKFNCAITTLDMVRQLDQETKLPTEWLSHWDNDHRLRITAHEQVIAAIKADPNVALGYKSEVVEAHNDVVEYTRVILITPTSIEVSI